LTPRVRRAFQRPEAIASNSEFIFESIFESSMSNVHQESLFIPLAQGGRLHLRHIWRQPGGSPVLMVHGAVANARTFYSEQGKGLAPWLAEQGYDVYVLDLRGRGLSEPAINGAAEYGQTEAICEDIPAALAEIAVRRGAGTKVGLVAHSWGGVLISAMLARYPELGGRIAASVYFASKRSIHEFNWRRVVEIDLVWNRLATMFAKGKGYLPARDLRIGADNETRKSLRQSQEWVRKSPWVDSDDGFNYASALVEGGLPPTLYLVGSVDLVRGHPRDVARFIAESGPHVHATRMLGKVGGLGRDYGHVDMLIHADAVQEIFPMVPQWLASHGLG
jgi:pimeloyl-ACP methyl ester carboxylesterase